MDDDVDFFTHKPVLNRKSKAKSKASSRAVNGVNGNAVAGPSKSSPPIVSSAAPRSTLHKHGVLKDYGDDEVMGVIDIDDDDDEDDEEEDTVFASSDVEILSDDSDASAKRAAKRRKKKHTKLLPKWASSGAYRRPSQEPTSSATVDSTLSGALSSDLTNGSSASDAASGSKEASNGNGGSPTRNGRPRRVSLTPPPPPSPEKLSMARDLVSNVIGSKFRVTTDSLTASSTNANGAERRQTRQSSMNPMSPSSTTIDDDDDGLANDGIQWDPDLARLMRGSNAKSIREEARRQQEEREAQRKQRELARIQQQQASLQAQSSQHSSQISRTQSAPQTRSTTVRAAADEGDSDTSVELVLRLRSSPRKRTQSATTAAPITQQDVIEIDDSDDEQPSRPATQARSPSPPPAEAEPEEEEETLSLTLQSKVGPLNVTVVQTTQLSKIIEHFHSKKLAENSATAGVKVANIKIMFDGYAYKANQTVGDMDVEDGDQVEITWS